AERVHADHGAGGAGIAIPADHRAHLYAYARADLGRQYLIAIGPILLLEELPGRQADDPRRSAFLLELLECVETQRDLAACSYKDDGWRRLLGAGKDVAAAAYAGRACIARAVESGKRLAAQHQTCRLVLETHDGAPRFGHFVGIGGAQRDQARDRAQRDELFHGLVRWPVLAYADRVMREHVDDRQLHQSGEAHRRLHVVGEDEEARAEGANFGKRETVQDRAHSVLAHAEVQVAAAGISRFQVAGVL